MILSLMSEVLSCSNDNSKLHIKSPIHCGIPTHTQIQTTTQSQTAQLNSNIGTHQPSDAPMQIEGEIKSLLPAKVKVFQVNCQRVGTVLHLFG